MSAVRRVGRGYDVRIARGDVLGRLRFVEGDGWRYYPWNAARSPSRKGHATADQALRSYGLKIERAGDVSMLVAPRGG